MTQLSLSTATTVSRNTPLLQHWRRFLSTVCSTERISAQGAFHGKNLGGRPRLQHRPVQWYLYSSFPLQLLSALRQLALEPPARCVAANLHLHRRVRYPTKLSAISQFVLQSSDAALGLRRGTVETRPGVHADPSRNRPGPE